MFWSSGSDPGEFSAFLAVRAVFDDQADGFFDAHPVVFLRNRRSGFVNAAVLLLVHRSGNLVLPLRIRHHFFVLQHQPLHPSLFLGRRKLVMRRSRPQSTLLRPVRPVGVFSMLEIKPDFIEAFFGDEIFALGTEVAAVDDGVDKGVGMGAQVAGGSNAPDSFESEGVPDAAGGEVGFVDEVEDGVGVALGEGLVNLAVF